ncbi:MAG: deoxyribodipyrimidine photo-lyase [Bdellovibrionales bacterium]|nr:deoxyribodipyrimidine photo-lyase [Bdellovibrionales bacterium]
MKNLCWIRRDLRLHDHAALSHALRGGETTLVFIFDPHILDKLENKSDKRVTFIYQSLQELEQKLQKKGSSLIIRYGKPEEEIPKLCQELKIEKVYTNRDYEPYAKKRDPLIEQNLKKLKVGFETFKDSVFFEKHEVLTGSGTVFKVFTPYKNKWLSLFDEVPEFECPLKKLTVFANPKNILAFNWYPVIGFVEDIPLLTGGTSFAQKRLKNFDKVMEDYKEARNFPAIEGTSYLSVYIRFGNISIRDMIRAALETKNEGSTTWLSEIIWRDFYHTILDAFSYVEKSAFKKEYDHIKWPGNPQHFTAWCEGRTGVPIVDAAMRCLNQTGMMHNRLRMIVASYLCKILLIDYRRGEHYFADHLLDYDLAANNGGWQWSSSSGCDAQPYFRIFNPYTQSEKFDADGNFIRQWLPELAKVPKKEIHRPDTLLYQDYPAPIVSYETNRMLCSKVYAAAIQKKISPDK